MEIDLPRVPRIPNEEQDPHSQRLLKVCDLWDKNFTDDQIKRARRAYYGAVSYVDDCVGKLLKVLEKCKLADDTIIVFSGDHGDMLGERGLWYVLLLDLDFVLPPGMSLIHVFPTAGTR